ncbi:MAG: hypothetical protein GYA15_12225 [Leptolinea sp.]|jgi:hypothetical protein|nr:hypothetical protein [Leptolinea sp.]
MIPASLKNLPEKHKKVLRLLAIALAFVVLVYFTYTFFPVRENADPPRTWGWAVDWKNTIRPGALAVITGATPYIRVTRCLPPWIYLLVSPIAVLPPELGAAIMFVLTYMVYAFILYRLKASPWVIAAFLCNTFVFINAKNGNVDFLAALGFLLPPQIGLFLVLSKPQVGIGMAFFWFIEAWRVGKLREIVRIFAPVVIAYFISFLFYGLWPLMVMNMTENAFVATLWPFSIPLGLLLLYKSIRERNSLFAMSASPFLAPYVNITSYAVTLIPFVTQPWLMPIIAALSWLR